MRQDLVPIGTLRDRDLIILDGAQRAGIEGTPDEVVHAAPGRVFDSVVVGRPGGPNPSVNVTEHGNDSGARHCNTRMSGGTTHRSLSELHCEACCWIVSGEVPNDVTKVSREAPAADLLTGEGRNGVACGIKAGRIFVLG